MAVSADQVRSLALALPEAAEADHHGMPSFRVGGKIFCTIHQDHPRIMVKLSLDDQDNLTAGHPGVVEPVSGYWGRKGSTLVWREKADQALVEMLLRLAWANIAPKRLLKTGA
jgi:hypothetical protein